MSLLKCILFSILSLSLAFNVESLFEISIIHFSDFHARFDSVAKNGGFCYEKEKEKCVGGIARISSIVERLRKIRQNTIFLNAGDNFQGTLFYDIFKGNITAHFMEKLQHDAMTIGNHDFDDGIPGLVSFLKKINTPIVVANIDNNLEPSLKNLYTNSTIIQRGNKKIGIIGVIASNTDKISSFTGKLKFLNEVDTINLESKNLKAKGVNIIIVLSHCGIEHDKIIANSCPDVDIIVGGHSHILLYNGHPITGEAVYDKYPIVITQKNTNRNVLIVHAGAYTKYMGDIRIVFNNEDEIVNWKGNPIYLDQSIIEDTLFLQELKPWKTEVNKYGKELIGNTRVYLNGSCSTGECTLGDLITDSMVNNYRNTSSISLMTADPVQNSILIGPILLENIYMSMAYNNTWDLIELQGNDLLQVLEENVGNSESNTSFVKSRLLLWSGLKVVYNLTNDPSKVVSVRVRCSNCEPERFEDLNVNTWYKVVVPTYIFKTFKTIFEKHRNHIPGKTRDIDNFIQYTKKIQMINTKIEGRMIFE